MHLMAYTLLILSILLGVVGQILLKRGMSRRVGFRLADLMELSRDMPVIAGFCCYGLSLLLYLKVLEDVALSLAYPTLSLGYAAVVLLSRALFNEPVSSTRWIALALICIGSALVGLGAS